MRTVRLLACAALLGLAPFVATGAAIAEPIVIDHVTVIEGDGPVLGDQTVVIDGERIARVVPTAVDGHPGGHHINGTGKYLMPGIMDMHIHLSGAFDPTKPAGAPQAVDRAEGDRQTGELHLRGRHRHLRRGQCAPS